MNQVQKYGGDYLKDIHDLKTVAAFIASHQKKGDGLVIVLAAMHSIVAGILDMADKVNDNIGKAELDALFSAGERQTASLMAVALEQEGVEAVSVADIRGYGLTPKEELSGLHDLNMEAIEDILRQGKVAVVAGFQGIGDYHSTERLVRYGAATTAVSIAAWLKCDCKLYGNTKGLYTLDPSASNKRRVIRKISYEETLEMILLGKNDLESRAVEIAKRYGVKIYVGPAMEEEEQGGTYIMDSSLIVKETVVSGISVSEKISVFTVKNIPADGSHVADIFMDIKDSGVKVDMISQQDFGENTCAISFCCRQDMMPRLKKLFTVKEELKDYDVSIRENLIIVSIVGTGMASHKGVAGKVLSVLSVNEIPYYNITTSEISICTVIDSCNMKKAVAKLGSAYNLD